MGAPVFLCGFNIEKHFFHSIIFHYHFIKNLRKNGRLPGDNSCSSIVLHINYIKNRVQKYERLEWPQAATCATYRK